MSVSEDKQQKSSVVYPDIQRFVLNLIKNKNTKFSTKDITHSYERKYKRKISKRTLLYALKKLKEKKQITIERHEQLWISGVGVYGLSLNMTNKIHSSHKIRLSIPYDGTQPMEDATELRLFGKHKNIVMAIYKTKPRISIIAYKNKLNVWVHRPKGISTKEQIMEAKKEGYLELVEFARSHELKLNGYLEKVIQSHHVIENMAVNEALKPTFIKHGTEIKERIGSAICQTSHKGQIEHEGVKRPDGTIVQGSTPADSIEYLMTQFPQDFRKFAGILEKYGNNIELHLKVLNQMNRTLKAIERKIKK